MTATDPTGGVLGITVRTAGYKVVSGLAAAGVTVVTARALGSDGRGVFVLVFTLATITYLLGMLGVNTAARVYLVAADRVVESNDYLGLCAALVVIEGVASALLGAVFLPIVGVHLSPAALVVTGMLGGSLLAQYTLFDAVNAYGRTDWAAALDAAGSVAQVVLVVVLAARGERDVATYLAALTAANALQVALELVSLRVMGISIRPRYRREAWRLLLRSGLPGAGLSLAQMLTFKVDRYLVGLFLTPTAVGLYSVAAAVPEMLRVPCVALSNSFFYRIASGAARPDDFTALRRAFILVAIGLSAVTAVAAPIGVRLVFGKEYLGAVGSLRVLLLAEVGVSVFQLDGFTLAGLNRIGHAASAAGIGLGVVTAFDLLLIPPFGIAGAAWASVIGYSVMGGTAALLLRRQAAPAGGPPPAPPLAS